MDTPLVSHRGQSVESVSSTATVRPVSAVQALQHSSDSFTPDPLNMQETSLTRNTPEGKNLNRAQHPDDYTSIEMSSKMFIKRKPEPSLREHLDSNEHKNFSNGALTDLGQPVEETRLDSQPPSNASKPSNSDRQKLERSGPGSDETDIVTKVMMPGASSQPLIASIKEELQRLSNRASEQMPGATFS